MLAMVYTWNIRPQTRMCHVATASCSTRAARCMLFCDYGIAFCRGKLESARLALKESVAEYPFNWSAWKALQVHFSPEAGLACAPRAVMTKRTGSIVTLTVPHRMLCMLAHACARLFAVSGMHPVAC